jgi:hypothetical protein
MYLTMKKADLLTIAFIAALILPFVFSETLYQYFLYYSKHYHLIMSFVKFAVLATLGEVIGHRIKTGKYSFKRFGLLPRMLVWGLLGITIALAFSIFSIGTPTSMDAFTGHHFAQSMTAGFSWSKLLAAFCISTAMNLTFAPVMMTTHKVTDTHIDMYAGKLKCLIKPVQVRKIFGMINWQVQWGFVFKKTILLFWIPAHTITFMLPAHFRVLFAALLGIVLGIILAVASLKSNKAL